MIGMSQPLEECCTLHWTDNYKLQLQGLQADIFAAWKQLRMMRLFNVSSQTCKTHADQKQTIQ